MNAIGVFCSLFAVLGPTPPRLEGTMPPNCIQAAPWNLGEPMKLVINELFLANDTLQDSLLCDEDGTTQSWVELYNPGVLPVVLEGFYLSNEPNTLLKWAIPQGVIGPDGFLRIWGSGKNRADRLDRLHMSFPLVAGDTLFLAHSDARDTVDVVHEMRVPADASFGRYPDGHPERYLYTRPTPGETNAAGDRKRFAIVPRHISLTVGRPQQLTLVPYEEVRWNSDNPLVQVDANGRVLAAQDALGERAQAVITATSGDGAYTDSCEVTIVNWTANLSELSILGMTPMASYILGVNEGSLLYTRSRELRRTNDGLLTSELLCRLPEDLSDPLLLNTPFGHFLKNNLTGTIYASQDLVTWEHSVTMNTGGLHHSFAYDWDADSQTGYLYSGEYSDDSNRRHAVWRGVFSPDGEVRWRTVLEFNSLAEWASGRSEANAAGPIYVVTVDPYTGHVWVGTGGGHEHLRLLYSDDHGESWRLLGMGNTTWSTLSMWFTEHYIYWSMYGADAQSIWRIPRSRFEEGGYWPPVTPELSSGTTKVGVRYCVTASDTEGYFPVGTYRIYVETRARSLHEKNRVIAITDPEYEYREEVAQLDNGTLWCCLHAIDDAGSRIVILCGSAEGALRDYRGRVFGIKESSDGTVDVQELLSITSAQPTVYERYVQLVPYAQDLDGYIYFAGRKTCHPMYKTKLRWTDDVFRP